MSPDCPGCSFPVCVVTEESSRAFRDRIDRTYFSCGVVQIFEKFHDSSLVGHRDVEALEAESSSRLHGVFQVFGFNWEGKVDSVDVHLLKGFVENDRAHAVSHWVAVEAVDLCLAINHGRFLLQAQRLVDVSEVRNCWLSRGSL